jgi:hypothetical protein
MRYIDMLFGVDGKRSTPLRRFLFPTICLDIGMNNESFSPKACCLDFLKVKFEVNTKLDKDTNCNKWPRRNKLEGEKDCGSFW